MATQRTTPGIPLAGTAKRMAELKAESELLKAENEKKMAQRKARLEELGVVTIDLPSPSQMSTIIPIVQDIIDNRKRFIIHVSKYQDDPREVADVPGALDIHTIAYRDYGLLALVACQKLLEIKPAEPVGVEFFNEAGNIVGVRGPVNEKGRRKVAILPERATVLLTISMKALWRIFKMPIPMPHLRTFVPETLKLMSQLLEEENRDGPADDQLTAEQAALRRKQEVKIHKRRAKRQRQKTHKSKLDPLTKDGIHIKKDGPELLTNCEAGKLSPTTQPAKLCDAQKATCDLVEAKDV